MKALRTCKATVVSPDPDRPTTVKQVQCTKTAGNVTITPDSSTNKHGNRQRVAHIREATADRTHEKEGGAFPKQVTPLHSTVFLHPPCLPARRSTAARRVGDLLPGRALRREQGEGRPESTAAALRGSAQRDDGGDD